MMEEPITSEQASKMTPEQLDEARAKMVKYWEDEIPKLKIQLEFEELIAKIEEMRYRRIEFITRRAQLIPDKEESKK